MALGDCTPCLSHKKASCWTMRMGWQWSFTTMLKFKHAQQNALGRWGVKGLGWLPLSTHLLQSVFWVGSLCKGEMHYCLLYYCSPCWLAPKQVKSAGKTLQEEKAGLRSSMLSLSSAAQAPWAHLTRSWRLPPGSTQQCSASSITFSWKWSFPFLWGRIIQSHWGGTTTTQLAGTKPRAL